MEIMETEVELNVVEHNGEKSFRYAAPDEQEVLFRHLLPFWEMLYRKVSVVRNGAEIGSTMALSIGTHGPLEVFRVSGLKAVFGENAACDDERESARHLSAKDFQVGDKLDFSFAHAPDSSFADILENVRPYIGIVSPPAENPVAGLHRNPD